MFGKLVIANDIGTPTRSALCQDLGAGGFKVLLECKYVFRV